MAEKRDKQKIERAAHCIKAMSNPLRLSLLAVLLEGEKSVQALTREVGTSQSNISQHLSAMRLREVVRTRREGNMIYYSISNPKVRELMVLMQEIFCAKVR